MTSDSRSPEARLAADEARAPRRRVGLGETFAEFLRHPSPWILLAAFTGFLGWRLVLADWRLGDLWGPLAFLAAFPVFEWLVHVFVLHWRPRKVAGVLLDYELARDHRRHHASPRDIPLVFIPWRSLLVVIAAFLGLALLAFPHLRQALTFVVTVTAVGMVYEWTHYLIHSDYKPRTRLYKAIWRNHRLHHYKNENYWFTVTTSGTADRLFRTYPAQDAVPTSPTAKNLHGQEASS